MRFCQVDGTTLVADEPAFDPYATIVSSPSKPVPLVPTVETAAPEIAAPQAVAEDPLHQTVGSVPIEAPDDVLDLPQADPLKTMYASDSEMQEILATDEPTVGETQSPEPPSFIAPEPPAPSFGDMAPPPSPFSTPNSVLEPAAPQPEVFEDPAPYPPVFDEPATVMQPKVDVPFNPPAPVAEWTPPPAPDANWQNQQIGSNTPFQPPPAGTGSQNQTLGIISLVLGILSFLCLGLLGSIPAIILGMMQRSKIRNNPGEFGGGGFAMAGIVLGVLNIIVTVIVLVIYVVLIAANMR
ncbi:MAG: DUF4190 domain-containing protein [Pyrinomonadaceae bacterium]